MHGLKDLVAFFEDSGLADAIREDDVLFPSIESVHVLAICLVVGSIMAVDLRLLGFASVKRPISAVTRGILPLTWGAFAVAVASGFLMFISNAAKYLGNGFFVGKLCLIAAAGTQHAGVSFHQRARSAALGLASQAAIRRAACRRYLGVALDSGGRLRPLARIYHGSRVR